mmetsp:Transcript_55724/g.132854  ORF Transcript_55724/g.132854 Transcript_55724/m.132854 type:complete len:88 (-) Transcript_55724:59-322(-)
MHSSKRRLETMRRSQTSSRVWVQLLLSSPSIRHAIDKGLLALDVAVRALLDILPLVHSEQAARDFASYTLSSYGGRAQWFQRASTST